MTDFLIVGSFVLNGLTLFFPTFPFDPPENIRKPLVLWCVQGDQKGILGGKELNKYSLKKLHENLFIVITEWAFTCSKLTKEILEQEVKYVQS